MDIRRWLDETVLPEQPPSPACPEKLGLAPFFHNRKPDRERPKETGRRRRSTSDSSLLNTPPPPRQRSPPTQREADIDDSADDSACSDAYHPAGDSRESSTSSQQYARRPRRKIRPERYEPISKDVKERGTQVYRHQKGESKKTRRKSRRNNADRSGIGLVQRFHAKNVPTDRLTLKPREKLGIFNKGRASTPVKGHGLPDLVFSEMKFLQKHKVQPDTTPQAGLPTKKRKKDHAHARQEEISAYFTSVRPALAKQDVNIQAKEATRPKDLSRGPEHEREPERSSLVDNALPTVELPSQKPSMGFDRRQPRHESGRYISWSESVWAPSAAPVRVQADFTINAGQMNSTHCKEDRVDAGGGDMLHSQAAPPSVPQRLTGKSDERFHASSTTPANHRVSRSHSFPQRICSPNPGRDNQRAGRWQTVETVVSASPRPAAIPTKTEPKYEHSCARQEESAIKSESNSHSLEHPKLNHQRQGIQGHEINSRINGNVDPQSSSSLDKILLECNAALNEGRWKAATSCKPSVASADPATVLSNKMPSVDTRSYGTIRRSPTVRFAGAETCSLRVLSYSGPSIYEEQARRQQSMQESHMEGMNLVVESYRTRNKEVSYDENDGLNYEAGQGWMGIPEESLPEESLPEESLLAELDIEAPMEDFVGSHGVGRGDLRAQEMEDVVAKGFWRPNKLY